MNGWDADKDNAHCAAVTAVILSELYDAAIVRIM